jgi:hypothetical protein
MERSGMRGEWRGVECNVGEWRGGNGGVLETEKLN